MDTSGTKPPTANELSQSRPSSYERRLQTERYELLPFVRHYTYVSINSRDEIWRTLPASADLFLQVIIRGGHVVRRVSGGQTFPAPTATLVGPYSRPLIEIGFSGVLELMVFQLQPSALLAIGGVQIQDLLNSYADATACGIDPKALIDDMRACDCDAQRVAAADRFAGSLFQMAPLPDAIGLAAQGLRDTASRLSLKTLTRVTGLSHRQFQRRFADQIGVAPKTYSRLSRMTALIEAREQTPDRPWADLAADFGFADQAHLSREFRDLTQQRPSRFSRFH